MIIVIEGAPGSGKTSLARRLQKEYHGHGFCTIYRYERPKSSGDLIRIQKEIDTLVSRTGEADLLIMDRHPAMSQPIFGPYTDFRDAYSGTLKADLIYYCDPGLREIRSNRTGSFYFEYLEEIRNKYADMIDVLESKYTVLLYDYTEDDQVGW